jgi:hypothetical protein
MIISLLLDRPSFDDDLQSRAAVIGQGRTTLTQSYPISVPGSRCTTPRSAVDPGNALAARLSFLPPSLPTAWHRCPVTSPKGIDHDTNPDPAKPNISIRMGHCDAGWIESRLAPVLDWFRHSVSCSRHSRNQPIQNDAVDSGTSRPGGEDHAVLAAARRCPSLEASERCPGAAGVAGPASLDPGCLAPAFLNQALAGSWRSQGVLHEGCYLAR